MESRNVITPYWFQSQAVSALHEYFYSGKTGAPLIALPTGTGKSVVIGLFIESVLANDPRCRIVMATHVKELIEQNKKRMLEIWPLAPVGIHSAGLKQRDVVEPIIFAGIASIYKDIEKLGHRDILIIDEAHLLSPDNDSMYQKAIEGLRKINPRLAVIGLTATTYRMGQGSLTDGGLFSDIVFDMTNVEGFNRLISEGFLSPVFPKRTKTELDVSGVAMVNGDYAKGELGKAVDKAPLNEKILAEMCYEGSDKNHWLIFASGVEHADHISDLLNNKFGVSAVSIHSKVKNIERDKRISDFTSGRVRCAVNNNVLTTGFDFPPIDLIGMMRPTMSPGLWVQMCLDDETEILTKNGWAKRGAISIGDTIPTFDLTNSSINYSVVTATINRPLQKWEEFYETDSPHINMRVTGEHELIYKSKRVESRWAKREAKLLPAEYLIPVSGFEQTEKSDLSDDEIRFIGWFIADGTYGKQSGMLSISQSSNSPYIEEITRVLNSAELNFSIYRHERKNGYADCLRFNISKYSWSRYSEFLDKSIPECFEIFSREQFIVLLDAMFQGDGRKAVTAYWTVHTRNIIIGIDPKPADRLQDMCVRRGIRCNITTSLNKPSAWNGDPKLQYFINYNPDKQIAHIKRESKLKNIGHIAGANVWCVTTDAGTIITRRKGKVSIMGNCGRGTRISPDTGKQNCLVLDFAGNTRRLGPINDPIRPRKKGQGAAGDAPVRICDSCGMYNHASARVCFFCGTEFKFDVKLIKTASTDELLRSDAPVIETYKVSRVLYNRHLSTKRPDAKPCIRVQYLCGLRAYTEWVLLDYPGAPGHRAREWWRGRTPIEPPTPATCLPYDSATDAALSIISTLRQPRSVRVWVNRPMPEVLSVEY